ncbi:GNAT family N-acetyltransferase [Alkaliphilus transvaalensis]|uniref:GNAT family N-acetyltransferase n=1 Tax=Alkaliphilus transvaalensis TaxID=114628 RepID=UPI00047AB691|nr:GNAT family N-acetyltransferase [Alkaliphilus transvaalensis]
MEWKIKAFDELTAFEVYEILKQRINVFVVEQDCPYEECDGKDLDGIHIFATIDKQVIAYIRVLPKGISYSEASIGRVIVQKDYRGKGIATQLMKKGIEYIKEEWKETQIRISAQAYLINFYNSLGFKVVSETYLEDGIPHVEMLHSK